MGLILAAVTATSALAGAPAHASRSPIGDGQGGIGTKKIGSFDSPVYVTGPESARGLVFVVERAGRIKMVKDGHKIPGTFLDITDRVLSGGEQGLLSVAFDPNYKRSRKFFVYYTEAQNDIVVEQYKRHPTRPRKALKGSARRMLDIPHPVYGNHNGGQLQFGPNRLLYAATGDGGAGGDPDENAQNTESLLGKMLRIDPFTRDGDASYSIPDSNPKLGRDQADEIFAIGLRNPYRFSFDRSKPNRLFIGDVGQNRFEEVDYDKVSGANGANYGWDAFEGYSRFSPDASPIPARHDEPIHVVSHDSGSCAITGGYVSRDPRLKSLWGRYLYTDYCNGDLRSLIPNLDRARGDSSTGIDLGFGTSSFGEDRAGRIYVANVATGQVSRLSPKKK